MNLVLIGYRGTGKSTVARLVAERLGWDFIDADAYLEQKAGRTIREIFEIEGEGGFRDREAAIIEELTARDTVVLAAGGGAVLRTQNRAAIKRWGKAVWLVASAEVIERRIASDPTSAERRPRLSDAGGLAEIRSLLAQREPLYRGCADLIVETDARSPAQVADEIVRWLGATGAPVTRPPARME